MLLKARAVNEIFQGHGIEGDQRAPRTTTREDELRKRLRGHGGKRKLRRFGQYTGTKERDIVKIETLFKMVTA